MCLALRLRARLRPLLPLPTGPAAQLCLPLLLGVFSLV